jgi:hypothetical protein
MKVVEIMVFVVGGGGGGGAVVELFLLEIMTKEEDELPRTTTARKRREGLADPIHLTEARLKSATESRYTFVECHGSEEHGRCRKKAFHEIASREKCELPYRRVTFPVLADFYYGAGCRQHSVSSSLWM